MPSPRTSRQDRLWVRDGFRHYRRTYSLAEVRWGLVTLVVLAAVAAWVVWKGANPDPRLFATATPGKSPALIAVKRDPLPEGIAGEGWVEGSVSRFDADSLYEKINGRADYYLARGFSELIFASLFMSDDPTVTVDIECYDLSSNEQALGAYAGERQPGIKTVVTSDGLGHLARNALYVVRGRYYIRAIGSEESQRVTAALRRIESLLEDGIEGEPLPWAYELFSGRLGLDPAGVTYTPRNAFSFGFAENVYSAPVAEGDAQLFAVHQEAEGEAEVLAKQFREGFASYGSPTPSEGMVWIEDRYLGTLSTAVARGAWVLGVKGAADAESGRRELDRLQTAVAGFKPPIRAASAEEEGVEEY